MTGLFAKILSFLEKDPEEPKTYFPNLDWWLMGRCDRCGYDLVDLPVCKIQRIVTCPECW